MGETHQKKDQTVDTDPMQNKIKDEVPHFISFDQG